MLNLADLKVMIVDDETFTQATIKQMLRVVGVHDVATANDGESALELTETFKPDIVLCDVAMKPMSGVAFLQKVRDHSDPGVRDTRIIMLTANKSVDVINEAKRLRVDGYLLKPVSAKQLGARLGAATADRFR